MLSWNWAVTFTTIKTMRHLLEIDRSLSRQLKQCATFLKLIGHFHSNFITSSFSFDAFFFFPQLTSWHNHHHFSKMSLAVTITKNCCNLFCVSHFGGVTPWWLLTEIYWYSSQVLSIQKTQLLFSACSFFFSRIQ